MKDFNDLGVNDVKDIPGGKTGTLPDGRKINELNSHFQQERFPQMEMHLNQGQLKQS